MEPITGSLIVGGAALASGLGGTIGEIYSQKKANETNIKLAREAQQHEIDMWKMANEYNLPQAQMERLREAGLNPNLVYGSGNVTATTSNVPKAHRATVDSVLKNYQDPTPQVLSALGAYTDLKKQNAMVDNVNSATWLNHQKASNESLKGYIYAIDKSQKFLDYEKQKELYETSVEYQKQNLEREILENERRSLDLEMEKALKPYMATSRDELWQRMLMKAFRELYKGKKTNK